MSERTEIERLEELWQEASPGEWSAQPGYGGDPPCVYAVGDDHEYEVAYMEVWGHEDEDSALIAALHNLWPEIKAELEAWRSMYDRRPYVCRDTDAAIRRELGEEPEGGS